MKQPKTNRKPWAEEDDALLDDIWKDAAPLKTQVGRIPNRTEYAMIARAKELGLPDRRTFAYGERAETSTYARVRSEMKAKPGTIAELAARAKVSMKTVRAFIEKHRAEMHIHKFGDRGAGGKYPAIWAWGVGKDATPPKAEEPKVIAKRYYHRKRRDPDFRERVAARGRLKYAIKTGKIVQRDPAAIALFGEPVR